MYLLHGRQCVQNRIDNGAVELRMNYKNEIITVVNISKRHRHSKTSWVTSHLSATSLLQRQVIRVLRLKRGFGYRDVLAEDLLPSLLDAMSLT